MTVAAPARRRGKPRREEGPLPPAVQQALVLRGAGASWTDCAQAVGMTTQNLRLWRKHPDADGFLQECVRSNLEQAHSLFADAAPRLANRLIELGLDPKIKGYTAVSAISEAFKILQTGVIEREQRQELQQLKDALDAMEGNNVIDV